MCENGCVFRPSSGSSWDLASQWAAPHTLQPADTTCMHILMVGEPTRQQHQEPVIVTCRGTHGNQECNTGAGLTAIGAQLPVQPLMQVVCFAHAGPPCIHGTMQQPVMCAPCRLNLPFMICLCPVGHAAEQVNVTISVGRPSTTSRSAFLPDAITLDDPWLSSIKFDSVVWHLRTCSMLVDLQVSGAWTVACPAWVHGICARRYASGRCASVM